MYFSRHIILCTLALTIIPSLHGQSFFSSFCDACMLLVGRAPKKPLVQLHDEGAHQIVERHNHSERLYATYAKAAKKAWTDSLFALTTGIWTLRNAQESMPKITKAIGRQPLAWQGWTNAWKVLRATSRIPSVKCAIGGTLIASRLIEKGYGNMTKAQEFWHEYERFNNPADSGL